MSSTPLSRSRKASLARAAETYHAQLEHDVKGMEYLAGRGLSSRSIETLRLGVVRSPLAGDDRYAGRLAIPYIGPRGNVYDLRYRCIEDHDCKEADCPKYLGYPDVKTRMYNVQALKAPTDYLLLTEGELDAATLVECGWPAVGIPGANAWHPHYSRMLSGFSRIVLIADGDDAGRKLASTVSRALPAQVRVIMCYQGQDVNSTFTEHGKQGLVDLLREDEEE